MIDWPADKIERRPIGELIPYARNPRTHTKQQVGQIAASMLRWGWTMPVLVDEGGGIIAGHGRVMAAKQLGYEEIPCVIAHGWDDAKRRAYVIADNKLTMNGGWDDELLAAELKDLAEVGFELDLTGFNAKEIDKLNGLDHRLYTSRLGAPLYEPNGTAPKVADLIDLTKTQELLQEIRMCELPEQLALFLEHAAQRHTVFHFALIADYYAHARPEVKKLMEKSALVIIDYDSALENGFVKLTAALDMQLEDEHGA